MKAKKLVMGLIILCFLISITCVSASENINDTIAEKDEISLDGTDLNSAVLKDSNERQKTIDELANEINNTKAGGKIILDCNYYSGTSNRSDAIEIIENDIILDGQGHTIDGNGSNMDNLFFVYSNSVTLKNIVFRNWDLTDNDNFIIWLGDGGIMNNCTFINNNADISSLIDWTGNDGIMDNCKFKNNTAITDSILYWTGDHGTVANTTFTNNIAENGGAIYYNGRNLTIKNCRFTKNTAEYGGAIYSCGPLSNILSSTFESNTATAGGAIYLEHSNYTIFQCDFISNNVTDNGGAIYSCGFDGKINQSIFENNRADEFGGAIYSTEDIFMIGNSKFTQNNASAGGAIFLENYGSITNTTFKSNTAEYGGAIFTDDINIDNSILEANYAKESGGALYAESMTITNNTTFIKNSAKSAGAINTDEGNIINSSFIQNSAENAGALFIGNSTIENSTFTKNTAKLNGGAIYLSGYLTLNNTVFEKNTAASANNILVESGNATFDNETRYDTPLIIKKVGIASKIKVNTYGYNFNLNVNLSASNKTFNEGEVTITINNKKYTAKVQKNTAEFSIANLNAGKYLATISFAYSDYGTTENFEFEIQKNNATITAKAKSFLINYAYKYSVILKDTNGKLITGKNVTFVLNGKTIGSATTNSKGVATFKITSKMLKTAKAGKKNLIIKLNNNNFNAVSKTVKLTIEKEKSKFAAKNKKFKRSLKTKKYKVTLKNSKGKAIKKMTVTIKVKGKTYKAKTNSKGKATFKITKLTKKGTFKAILKFKTTKYYKGCSKKVKIIVR